MKKILCAILILTLFMAEAVTAYAAGPQEPTIEAQMPDCYGIVGESAIMLFTNAASPDGGTLEYQWYSTTVDDKEVLMKVSRVYYNDNEILIAGHLIEDVLEHPVFYPFERRRYECQEITDESLIIDYNSESYRKFYKEHYPAGTRIVLFGMKNEPHPLPRGARGTVKHVCDDPMVHVTFDNGRYLGLIPDVDQFAKLKDE